MPSDPDVPISAGSGDALLIDLSIIHHVPGLTETSMDDVCYSDDKQRPGGEGEIAGVQHRHSVQGLRT